VVWDDGAQILADSDGQFRGNPVFQGGLGCDTWAHAVEFPIRKSRRIAASAAFKKRFWNSLQLKETQDAMSKIIDGREGPVFGIKSSADMFEKLKYESSRLQQGWHPYDAFNFLVTAWHLFEDWPKSDEPRALCRMKRQRSRLPSSMCFTLDVLRDLVNGSKHFQLNPDSVKKRRVTEVHTGKEVGLYELLFHEDLPAVTVDPNWYFSIRVLHNLTLRYFEWVFDDLTPVKEFPPDLLEAILYCDVANRGSGVSPAIWLLGIESAYISQDNMEAAASPN